MNCDFFIDSKSKVNWEEVENDNVTLSSTVKKIDIKKKKNEEEHITGKAGRILVDEPFLGCIYCITINHWL